MGQFSVFFIIATISFVLRPSIPPPSCPGFTDMGGWVSWCKTCLSYVLRRQQQRAGEELHRGRDGGRHRAGGVSSPLSRISAGYGLYLDIYSPLTLYLICLEVRAGCDVTLLILAILYLLEAVRELCFLGSTIFLENMKLCPSRVLFLLSCLLLQICVPIRLACLYEVEDSIAQVVMLTNGLYFLFFCRGFKLVGPMVIMIYLMLKKDVIKFGIIFSIFLLGFSQASRHF